MDEGLIIALQFTAFDVELNSNSCIDHLKITDGDGTTLMEETCGGSSYGNILVGGQIVDSVLPGIITSKSNVTNLIFTSSDNYTRTGWSIKTWVAFGPPVGECHNSEYPVNVNIPVGIPTYVA